jgi:signal transduction histidine kinase
MHDPMHDPMHDLAFILGLTTVCCLLIGLLGLLAVQFLGRRALRLTVVFASLVPVFAVAVSVLVNVQAMFLSRHDSFVILVALGWASVIAAGLTVAVGNSVSAGEHAVRAGLQRLGAADEPLTDTEPTDPQLTSTRRTSTKRTDTRRTSTEPAERAPAELASLAAEMDVIRERLVASRLRERALEQSRRELVAFMSHDLRTPLAGLRALAEGLEDGVVDDVPAAMTRIRGTVDRLTLLVDDLFQLSRVTGGTQRPRRLVSLAEVAMDVATEAGDHAGARDVRVEVELPGTEDRLPVLGDADELVRALTNLVANAVRHTENGGTVRVIGSRGADGRARVAVLDGCGGIPEPDLEHVFETGWRGSPARTPDDGGAGLGLAIARGVIESHAGDISVQNVDGGCSFELSLPIAR